MYGRRSVSPDGEDAPPAPNIPVPALAADAPGAMAHDPLHHPQPVLMPMLPDGLHMDDRGVVFRGAIKLGACVNIRSISAG